jgi:hypothetical protein
MKKFIFHFFVVVVVAETCCQLKDSIPHCVSAFEKFLQQKQKKFLQNMYIHGWVCTYMYKGTFEPTIWFTL